MPHGRVSMGVIPSLRGRVILIGKGALMKLRCSRMQMLAALQLVNTAVAGHDHRPVLHNVKAIAADDHCSLLATDTEMGIRREISGIPIHESGEALLPANRILAIFRETPDEDLVI